MAGTFAHITLVDTFCQNPDELDAIKSLSREAKYALTTFNNFCELGAVSPDYPYLSLLDGSAAGWANAMHYYDTADFVRIAIPHLLASSLDAVDTQRCIAWVFGYVAHLVTDLTIHPVINLEVGPYEDNKTAHRVCEMHQDVYIFNNRLRNDIGSAEYIRNAGIASCSDESDSKQLHAAIRKLWLQCLDRIPRNMADFKRGAPGPTSPPEPDRWHANFVTVIDKIAEEGGRLGPLSRHFAEEAGLVYPELKDAQPTYLEDLQTPEGPLVSYDQIFDRARDNLKTAWGQLGEALSRKEPEQFALSNGDLDTGQDRAGRFVFWEAMA